VNINVYIKIARPNQWLKNLMLFFPPFLGGLIFNPGIACSGIIPFISFCLASSSMYVLNDILDRENDSKHPVKQRRPISSGKVPVLTAYGISAALLLCSLILSTRLSLSFFMILVCYMGLSLAYSFKLKELPIVDIFCISSGFLLRLQAGGEVFQISISEWLFLSVFLLSVFLSTGKRLGEKNALGLEAGNHRKTLTSYPEGFLDGTMYMTGAAVLVTYTLYVISRHSLVYTVPVCAFGLLRYIFRVKAGEGGDPTESLLKDIPLFLTGVLWAFMIGWSIYR